MLMIFPKSMLVGVSMGGVARDRINSLLNPVCSGGITAAHSIVSRPVPGV